MDYTIINAHAHLWLRQDTMVDGLPIRTLENGRSLFMGEIRQIVLSKIVKSEEALAAMQEWMADPGKVFRILVEF